MRYGMLTVIEQHGGYWKVKCDCGVEKEFLRHNVINHYRSCGCQKFPHLVDLKTHGMSATPEYELWQGIKRRCYNPKRKDYKYYGGRGIKMHEPWINSFEQFIKDLGRRPSHDMTLDRINTYGNYEPGNLRWVTIQEQQKNRRPQYNVNYYLWRGEMVTLRHIQDETGISRSRLKDFVMRRGKDVQQAIDRIHAIDAAKQRGSN